MLFFFLPVFFLREEEGGERDHPHCHSTALVVFSLYTGRDIDSDDSCARPIIHVRTAHRRCQAQIVAQDTEQKHGKQPCFFFWRREGPGVFFFAPPRCFFWEKAPVFFLLCPRCFFFWEREAVVFFWRGEEEGRPWCFFFFFWRRGWERVFL